MPVIPKGRVIQGEDARVKVTEDILSKSDLNPSDIKFILTKLKDASYKGHEFESFYAIWVKLNALLKKVKTDSKGL